MWDDCLRTVHGKRNFAFSFRFMSAKQFQPKAKVLIDLSVDKPSRARQKH